MECALSEGRERLYLVSSVYKADAETANWCFSWDKKEQGPQNLNFYNQVFFEVCAFSDFRTVVSDCRIQSVLKIQHFWIRYLVTTPQYACC